MSHLKYVLDFVKVLGIIAPDYWFKMPISAHFFDRLMNSKTTLSLSTMAIAAVVLLFASGPIVASQQASALVVMRGGMGPGGMGPGGWGHGGWGHGGWGHGGWGHGGWGHGGWGWHRHWWGHGGWGWHRHWWGHPWGWHHGWWGHRVW